MEVKGAAKHKCGTEYTWQGVSRTITWAAVWLEMARRLLISQNMSLRFIYFYLKGIPIKKRKCVGSLPKRPQWLELSWLEAMILFWISPVSRAQGPESYTLALLSHKVVCKRSKCLRLWMALVRLSFYSERKEGILAGVWGVTCSDFLKKGPVPAILKQDWVQEGKDRNEEISGYCHNPWQRWKWLLMPNE